MRFANFTILAPVIFMTGALFYVWLLTPAFAPAIPTQANPAVTLCLVIAAAGLAWFCLLFIFRDIHSKLSFANPSFIFPIFILIGLGLRLLFFDSTPVYENDFKRYLWDGAVTATSQNPYAYSPSEVYAASAPGTASVPELARLAVLSNQADGLTGEINSPDLTTIYPPAAQAVFAAAYWIDPFQPWSMKAVFLIFELLGFAFLLAGLRSRGLPLIWSSLYWLNPIIMFTTYNGLHMDVLLVAPLLGALLYVGRRPLLATILLSLAAAIKIWPLLLAPILFRQWRDKLVIYIGIACLTAILTLLSFLPMLLAIGESSGLLVYSTSWTNSSFLFPVLREGLGLVLQEPDRTARYVVAAFLTGTSLWFGFKKPKRSERIPTHLLGLAALFVFLSPTGYPWYFIWFLMFLPFAVGHWSARGLGLLTIGAAVYFIRFQLGEAGQYDIYTHILLPLEFGIPLLVLFWDALKARTRGTANH